MKEELKQFDINIDDIQENNNLFDNISEAIYKMSLVTMKDRFEIILNNNLIETKEKATNYRTIFGCRISYENLDKNISFIVREDTEPSYKELQHQLDQYKNNWEELKNYTNNVIKKYEKYDNENNCEWQGYNFAFDILNKMKELEEEK